MAHVITIGMEFAFDNESLPPAMTQIDGVFVNENIPLPGVLVAAKAMTMVGGAACTQ